jgi:hypothetical protein
VEKGVKAMSGLEAVTLELKMVGKASLEVLIDRL